MIDVKGLHIWMPNITGNSGSDVFVKRLAAGLRHRGATVTIDWFDKHYEVAPGLLSRFPAPPGADLVHSNGLNAFAFRNHGLPLVVTEHHFVLDPTYRPYKSFLQHIYHRMVTGRASLRSIRAATALATPSVFVAESVVRACPACDPAAIPLWVDINVFTQAPSKPLTAAGPVRMLFVGNTSRRKGFDVVIELARRLGSSVEISCTGGLRGDTTHGLPPNVYRTGRLSDEALVEAYRYCDIVLVPSRYEGFGYAALEGMACGKPILGFACGSVEEIVDNGVTGFLVPVDDIGGLVRCATELINSPGLRSKMGRAGRERAEQVFSEDRGIDAYFSLYASALNK